jgi:hypothetical protein
MIRQLIWILVIASWIFPPTSLWAEHRVTAKGVSFFEPGREAVARERAVDEAKRSAIEKAVGVAVTSKTVVEDFQVVKDQIFSRASGYLRDITIVDEKKTGLGTYEVTLTATVEVAALVDDTERFLSLLQWQKNPTVTVRIEPEQAVEYQSAARKTANLLTERLTRSGFQVIRSPEASGSRAAFAVPVAVALSSRTADYQGLELTLNEVSLTATVVRTGDGEVLAASSAVVSIPGENRLQVLDKGTRRCVIAVWEDLQSKLTRLWERELYSKRDIRLVLHAVSSYARAREVLAVFQSDVSGVVAAHLIRFEGDTADYRIQYRGWPEQLAGEFDMTYFRRRHFDAALRSISGNTIVLTIINP